MSVNPLKMIQKSKPIITDIINVDVIDSIGEI